MADVFLSYHSADRPRARVVAAGLAAEGFSVWWDRKLRAGEAYDEAIERQLRAARVVVALWSPRSVRSRWVRAECAVAERRGALAPAMIEPCERPLAFELLHAADLAGWSGERADARWRGFAADIRAMLARAPQAAAAPDVEAPRRPSVWIGRAWLIAFAVLALALAGVWRLSNSPQPGPPAASASAPASDMARFAEAPEFLPMDRLVAASEEATLCADHLAAENSCRSITRFRRLSDGGFEEVERVGVVLARGEAQFETIARFRLADGFACYDEPGAVEVRVAAGAVPNEREVLASMRAMIGARAEREGRVCVGAQGVPAALRLAGFDAQGAAIRDPSRWSSLYAAVRGEPSLRAQAP